MDLSIKVDGLEELIANVRKAKGSFDSLLLQAMNKATTEVQNEAKAVKEGRFKTQTGTLRRSILREVQSAQKGLVYVASDAPYGIYVELGSGPHTIEARGKKALAFKGPSGIIFAKRVNHPGSKPYPFMSAAFEAIAPKIPGFYQEAADKIVQIMAGQ